MRLIEARPAAEAEGKRGRSPVLSDVQQDGASDAPAETHDQCGAPLAKLTRGLIGGFRPGRKRRWGQFFSGFFALACCSRRSAKAASSS